MFSLIISIISIALMAALSVATIAYGFYAYNNNSIYTKATYLLNTANTIATAAIFAKNEGVSMTGMSVDNVSKLKDAAYLTHVPNYESVDFVIDADESLVKIQDSALLSLDVCKQIIANYDTLKFDTVSTIPDDPIDGRKYGCHVGSSGAGYYTFYYRIDK
jgi:hypothetical protein